MAPGISRPEWKTWVEPNIKIRNSSKNHLHSIHEKIKVSSWTTPAAQNKLTKEALGWETAKGQLCNTMLSYHVMKKLEMQKSHCIYGDWQQLRLGLQSYSSLHCVISNFSRAIRMQDVLSSLASYQPCEVGWWSDSRASSEYCGWWKNWIPISLLLIQHSLATTPLALIHPADSERCQLCQWQGNQARISIVSPLIMYRLNRGTLTQNTAWQPKGKQGQSWLVFSGQLHELFKGYHSFLSISAVNCI